MEDPGIIEIVSGKTANYHSKIQSRIESASNKPKEIQEARAFYGRSPVK